MKKDHGIVLYADILGYRSFLANTLTTDPATENVISLLESCSAEAKTQTLQELPVLKEMSFIMDQSTAQVFSDTVVVVWPIPPDETKLPMSGRWVYALTYGYILHDHMLKNGLPVRGAITIGDYVLSDRCFAGASLIEAYDLAQSIDASAFAITPRAYAAIAETAEYGQNEKFRAWFRRVVRRRQIPTKTGHTEMHALGFSDDLRHIAADGHALLLHVYTAFAKWNKLLSTSATRKADNTIALAKEMRRLVE